MINTIIFDFGDVLVRDTTKFMKKHFYFEKLSQTKKKKFITAFHLNEVGKLSNLKLNQTIHQTLSPKLSPKQIAKFLISHAKTLKAWSLIHSLLKKNYQVIILSNNQRNGPARYAKKLHLDLTRCVFVNSAEVGMHKPYLNFYKYTIKKYKLNPQKTVFIDDTTANLIPAKRLGITTFHYSHDYKKLVKFLKNHGIKI
jgi:putative hydrolase of the HAD superfamily